MFHKPCSAGRSRGFRVAVSWRNAAMDTCLTRPAAQEQRKAPGHGADDLTRNPPARRCGGRRVTLRLFSPARPDLMHRCGDAGAAAQRVFIHRGPPSTDRGTPRRRVPESLSSDRGREDQAAAARLRRTVCVCQASFVPPPAHLPGLSRTAVELAGLAEAPEIFGTIEASESGECRAPRGYGPAPLPHPKPHCRSQKFDLVRRHRRPGQNAGTAPAASPARTAMGSAGGGGLSSPG